MSKHLYANYCPWIEQNGEERHSKDWLTKTIKQQHGCVSEKANGARGLRGICVKVEARPDPRTGERED